MCYEIRMLHKSGEWQGVSETTSDLAEAKVWRGVFATHLKNGGTHTVQSDTWCFNDFSAVVLTEAPK